jgi:hypothetical protein
MPEAETAPSESRVSFDQAAEKAISELAAAKAGETKPEAQPAAEQTVSGETPPAEAPDEILSEEEVSRLAPEQKAIYRKMQKAYTQKTQKLAAERKRYEQELEKLSQWKPLIEDLEREPSQAIARLAEQLGLEVAPAAKESEEDRVGKAVEEMRAKLRALHGPEYQAYADQLADIFRLGLEQVTQTVVDERITPLVARQEEALAQIAMESTAADLKAMDERHPDWREHEAKMLEIAQRWIPAEGSDMTAEEYLDALYYMATRDRTETAATHKVAAKLAEAARSTEPEAPIPSANVTPARPKRPTFEEAFQAAKKGIAW